MGDISVYNDAGLNDSGNTVTSYNGQVTRISEVLKNLQELVDTVGENTAAVQNMTQGASAEMDTFKEIEDQLDPQAFIDALNAED